MYKIFVLAAAIFALSDARVVNPCVRNPGSLPLTTVVEGCNTTPCILHSSRPLNIRMTFRAPRRLNNMLTIVTGYFNLGNAILPMQVDLGSAANTCNNLSSGRCPVNQGDLVNYTLRLVPTGIPLMHVIPFEVRVVDHGPMICVMVPMRAEGRVGGQNGTVTEDN